MDGACVQLGLTVWPTFVGVSDGTHEPTGMDYERGAIAWKSGTDGVCGTARIHAPKGTWTHYVFYSGPQPDATVMGRAPMPYPIIFDRAGIIDVDPIRNTDVLPRLT